MQTPCPGFTLSSPFCVFMCARALPSVFARCVAGNCFSLQREHEAALRLFTRATQLDPLFTYAHTLAGHEHLVRFAVNLVLFESVALLLQRRL